jgi:hypothetical protein
MLRIYSLQSTIAFEVTHLQFEKHSYLLTYYANHLRTSKLWLTVWKLVRQFYICYEFMYVCKVQKLISSVHSVKSINSLKNGDFLTFLVQLYEPQFKSFKTLCHHVMPHITLHTFLLQYESQFKSFKTQCYNVMSHIALHTFLLQYETQIKSFKTLCHHVHIATHYITRILVTKSFKT